MTVVTSTRPVRPTVSARRTKDHLYLVRRGFIYASPYLNVETTNGFAAIVVIALRGELVEIRVAGQAYRFEAVAAKPMIPRGLSAENLPVVTVGVSPNHALYRRFRAIPTPGIAPLHRHSYAEFDAELLAAYGGQLAVPQAIDLFERLVSVSVQQLPCVKDADPRIERALEMLREKPTYPLTELAAAVGLSHDHMSHLFTEAVGLPLRSYSLWTKLHAVSTMLSSGMTLTEMALAAGFTDSAHLSRTWMKVYGACPSYFINNENVAVHSLCGEHAATRGTGNRPFGPPVTSAAIPTPRCRHCGAVLSDGLNGAGVA